VPRAAFAVPSRMTPSGIVMSALPRRTDIPKEECHVRKVPKGDFTKSAAYGAKPTFWLDDEIG
jgi:hypothetical protein